MEEVTCWRIRTSQNKHQWMGLNINFCTRKAADEIAKQLRAVKKADDKHVYVEVYRDKCYKGSWDDD